MLHAHWRTVGGERRAGDLTPDHLAGIVARPFTRTIFPVKEGLSVRVGHGYVLGKPASPEFTHPWLNRLFFAAGSLTHEAPVLSGHEAGRMVLRLGTRGSRFTS
jgi:hypothetical protein